MPHVIAHNRKYKNLSKSILTKFVSEVEFALTKCFNITLARV